ncbi:MAG: hypothetical protein QM760_21950 [Nibricoccus sp.]
MRGAQLIFRVAHAERAAGRTKYSLYKLIRLNFDLMTGFSVVPLQLFTLFGFIVAGSGLLFGVFLSLCCFVWLCVSEAEGVFTLFALAFVVMGILMAGLGIVGEYIGRVYQEVRGRPPASWSVKFMAAPLNPPNKPNFTCERAAHSCVRLFRRGICVCQTTNRIRRECDWSLHTPQQSQKKKFGFPPPKSWRVHIKFQFSLLMTYRF